MVKSFVKWATGHRLDSLNIPWNLDEYTLCNYCCMFCYNCNSFQSKLYFKRLQQSAFKKYNNFITILLPFKGVYDRASLVVVFELVSQLQGCGNNFLWSTRSLSQVRRSDPSRDSLVGRISTVDCA